jgi:hypothetical protein
LFCASAKYASWITLPSLLFLSPKPLPCQHFDGLVFRCSRLHTRVTRSRCSARACRGDEYSSDLASKRIICVAQESESIIRQHSITTGCTIPFPDACLSLKETEQDHSESVRVQCLLRNCSHSRRSQLEPSLSEPGSSLVLSPITSVCPFVFHSRSELSY